MDITPKSKKIMSKDEVALLIDLIQTNPILTSKETNATTNRNKEDTWSALTSLFNAKSGSVPRAKEQLKLKWDNLKKAARKRTQLIRLNNLKTGGGKPDFIPPDEILDKVASLLGSTCTGFVVPFGGDGAGIVDTDDIETDEGSEFEMINNDARPNVPDDITVSFETPSKGTQERKRKLIVEGQSPVAGGSNNFFGMPLSNSLKPIKKGKKKADDGRLARNLAIAKYYDKKSEKLDIEIKILKLELANKENSNSNINNDNVN